MNQRMKALLEQLTEVRDELQSPAPDKSRVRSIVDSLTKTWVPAVITNVLSTVITACLGV
jgi:hypothetical protein